MITINCKETHKKRIGIARQSILNISRVDYPEMNPYFTKTVDSVPESCLLHEIEQREKTFASNSLKYAESSIKLTLQREGDGQKYSFTDFNCAKEFARKLRFSESTAETEPVANNNPLADLGGDYFLASSLPLTFSSSAAEFANLIATAPAIDQPAAQQSKTGVNGPRPQN